MHLHSSPKHRYPLGDELLRYRVGIQIRLVVFDMIG